jgi:hypothetical protein
MRNVHGPTATIDHASTAPQPLNQRNSPRAAGRSRSISPKISHPGASMGKNQRTEQHAPP